MNIAKKNIDFGLALCAAKNGRRIARAGWNGRGIFVFQRPADDLPLSIIPNVKSLPQAVKDSLKMRFDGYNPAEISIRFGAYLCMFAADGSIVNGWLPSQTDMLATDWTTLD